MKAGFRTSAQAAVLRAVHDHPGMTRAQVAAEIGIPSGFAAETVARLVAAELIAERRAPATGQRGRPTTALSAHPDGPLVAAAAIGQETWQVAAVELGGTMLAATSRARDGDQGRVLGAVAAGLERIRDRFGARVLAAAVAVPGTVAGSRLVLAPGLSWHGVDLSGLWQHYEPGSEFVVGNDATLAGLAESRRAPGFGSGTMLYLHVADGIGGAVIEAGRAVMGATGAAGEFGHMPFGDPGRRCRCGATGCWNTSIDGPALARLLPGNVPGDGDGSLRHVLASARAGDPGALSAIRTVGGSIGRGVAGLVNGMDPHLVVVGGLGPELLHIAADEITAAYHDGLMAYRVVPPPPIAAARLAADGPLLGAADEAFTRLLTDEGLQAWAARKAGAGAPPAPG
ncbi:MAG TPA: ROK family transcriptional regulator [Trebonia sp.]|nr:ROK family transcriptional regulator [Trebonia sp.]